MTKKLILASGSPRRVQLLRDSGFQVQIIKPNVDESSLPHEKPSSLVKRLSTLKAHAVIKQLGATHALIIAADTIVVLNKNQILGKPVNSAHAQKMLKKLSGKMHVVMTGFCILQISQNRIISKHTRTIKTNVWIRSLTPQEIRAYVKTGEPLDKAGSYAAQGIGMGLIEKISGSYTNVVGLPMAETLQSLRRYI